MLGDVVYLSEAENEITFNSDNGAYPITAFDDVVESRMDSNSKMEQDGIWPTYGYDDGMEITLEGAILADDSDDYTTKRNTLAIALREKVTPRTRRSGVLTVDFDGATELVKADVTVRAVSIPRSGTSPNFSEFRIVFFSTLPYWVGVDTGDPYYDS